MNALLMPKYDQTDIEIGLGDWIKVFLPRLGVWHHGIVRRIDFVGHGYAVQVVNNAKGIGITTSDWHDFREGQRVLLHKRPSANHVRAIFARADSNIGKPYHLFAQNCEHFASLAFTGKSESESLQWVGLIAAGILAVGIFASLN
ncbi:MAG TPA: lecithin retinol acyltransferase family protein [Candidatus Angelobacter sp.]